VKEDRSAEPQGSCQVAAFDYYTGPEVFTNKLEYTLIFYPAGNPVHENIVIDCIEGTYDTLPISTVTRKR
jgi:hypothetical protein